MSERNPSAPARPVYELVKRLFDVAASTVLLIALGPLLAAVAIAVKLDSRGPVFFRQSRTGRGGRPFRIFKFRTMVVDAERLGPLVTSAHDPRTTRVGRILRITKIDELPQLLNVILGDMSLVGPRPQVPRYTEKFPLMHRAVVLSVRPGITSPTSLAFRHEEEILSGRDDREEYYISVLLPIKCRLDAEYVAQRSALQDAKALADTGRLFVGAVSHRILRRPMWRQIDTPIAQEIAAAERLAA